MTKTISYKQKDLIAYFFTRCEDPDYYICNNPKCQAKCKQRVKTGYTNLKKHLRSCMGDNFESNYCDFLKSSEETGRLQEVYKLLRWIVMRNMALSELDNDLTMDLLNTKAI